MARLEIIVDSGTAKRNTDDLTRSLAELERAGNNVEESTKKATQGIGDLGLEAENTDPGLISLERSLSLFVATLIAAGVAAAGGGVTAGVVAATCAAAI